MRMYTITWLLFLVNITSYTAEIEQLDKQISDVQQQLKKLQEQLAAYQIKVLRQKQGKVHRNYLDGLYNNLLDASSPEALDKILTDIKDQKEKEDLLCHKGKVKREGRFIRVTPIYYFALKRDVEFLKILSKHGGNRALNIQCTDKGNTPIHEIVQWCICPVPLLRIEASDINYVENTQRLLNNAQSLLKSKANLTIENYACKTPLMVAIDAGRAEFVELLLNAKADPSEPNSAGIAALTYAANKADEFANRLSCPCADSIKTHLLLKESKQKSEQKKGE